MISPVVAAALCMKPRGMLTINQARKVDALKQESHEFVLMRSLALRFRGIFRSRQSSKLDIWIDHAANSAPVLELRPPAFCAFNDMMHFEELRVFNFA